MRAWIKQTGVPLLATIACVAISFAAAYAAHRHRLLRVAEFELHDHLLAHSAAARACPSPCMVIAVTEADVRKLGGKSLSDRAMADLLKAVIAGAPAAIGVDILRDYSIPEPNEPREEQQRDWETLERVIKNDDVPVVMPHLIGPTPEDEVLPPSFLKESTDAEHIGFVDFVPDDPDGVVRRALLYRTDHQDATQNRTSLSLRLALDYLDDMDRPPQFSADRERIQTGPSTFSAFHSDDGAYVNADANGFQILMDYGGPMNFDTFSVGQVLAPGFDSNIFRNRVVLIGQENGSVKDYFRTPTKSQEYGVVIHARIADQIIRAATVGHAVLGVASNRARLALLIAICVGGGFIGWSLRHWQFVVAVGLIIAALFLLQSVSLSRGTWVPTVPLMMGFLLSAGSVTIYMSYLERMDRLAWKSLFEKTHSKAVADSIWEQRYDIFENGRLKIREMCATVLFTDLVGFSAISQKLSERALIEWLNEYFEKISKLVLASGGNINKFNGDQIVAVFGPPLDRNDAQVRQDARGAVCCAIEMRKGLRELNEYWSGQGKPQVRMRVGIHTGELVAGSLGSRERQEWTVIGDTVNIASRLESFDKSQMGSAIGAEVCRILTSDSTLKRLDHTVLQACSLGSHELTGREHQNEVFAVIDYGPSVKRPYINKDSLAAQASAKGSDQPCEVA